MSEQEVDEQLEALKKWWKDNGKFVIIGMAIILGVLAYVLWQREATKSANKEAALAYHSMESQLTDAKDATKEKAEQDKLKTEAATTLTSLRAEHAEHGYTALASLLMAREKVVEKDYQGAAAELQWVVDNQADTAFAPLARVRLSRVQVQLGDCAAATQTLEAGKEGRFEGLKAQLEAYCLQLGGNTKPAREAYLKALEETDKQYREPIQWQLNELGEE